MSFEDEVCFLFSVSYFICACSLFQDLLAAIAHTKHANIVAQRRRKKAASFASRVVGFMTPSLYSGVNWVKTMTPVERHAELIYAEALFEKVCQSFVDFGGNL
jgi:hypothetical protein